MNNIFEFIEKPCSLQINAQFRPGDPLYRKCKVNLHSFTKLYENCPLISKYGSFLYIILLFPALIFGCIVNFLQTLEVGRLEENKKFHEHYQYEALNWINQTNLLKSQKISCQP